MRQGLDDARDHVLDSGLYPKNDKILSRFLKQDITLDSNYFNSLKLFSDSKSFISLFCVAITKYLKLGCLLKIECDLTIISGGCKIQDPDRDFLLDHLVVQGIAQ